MLENYTIDKFGVIHQVEWRPKIYDAEYLSYYEGLRDRTIKLGYQRFGWVAGVLRRLPSSLLEIGYGLGTFLEAAQIAGVPRCVGCDVTRYPLPQGCEFLGWEAALDLPWDHVGMFDVLEHIPDLSFLDRLQATSLSIAVPNCRWRERGDAWFADWRMRLPDEHLHHFDADSLQRLLEHHGFECVQLTSLEEGLRLREGETGPNIICGFFVRRQS